MGMEPLQKVRTQRLTLEREKYQTNFLAFLKEVLNYTDVEEQPHNDIIQTLLSPSQYKMFLLPRGSFKSSIITIGYSMWRITQNPNIRILIDSKTLEKARMFLSEIKYHIEYNQRFKDLYGDWKYVPGFQEGAITVPQRTKPLKEATIETGGVNSPQTGGHYDMIVADDLHDEKNVASEIERQRVILHFKTLFPILEPKGQLILVGTRWHWDDLYSWVIKNEKVNLL